MLLTWLRNLIMPQETKECRVCGKEYKACRTQNVNKAFRWQDITCSPECGEEYLRRIRLSRGSIIPAEKPKAMPEVQVFENKKPEKEEEFELEEIQDDDTSDLVEE